MAEKVIAAGMRFGYHNHTMEFHEIDGVVPYDELMRLTDPAKVTFEMDCGWVVVGGGNPIDYLKNTPPASPCFTSRTSSPTPPHPSPPS